MVMYLKEIVNNFFGVDGGVNNSYEFCKESCPVAYFTRVLANIAATYSSGSIQ